MEILGVLMGLIGAILGAIIASYASIKAAKMTIRALYKEERDKVERSKKERKNTMIRALLIETQENLQLNEKGNTRGKKVLFADEAWTIYKKMIYALPENLQKALIIAYNEVKVFNSIIAYDIADRSFREPSITPYEATSFLRSPGAWNDADIEEQADNVRQAFRAVKREISKILQIKK